MSYVAAAVTLVALAVYVRTMMPSTFFWDTGEAHRAGHAVDLPPDRFVYAMLGWLWSQLPFGEVAVAHDLLSGVCVALASGLVVLITGT